MKLLRSLTVIAIVLSIVAFGASFFVESSFKGRSELVQRVRKDAGSELFGDEGTPVGSAQVLIIDDRKAFTGQKSPEGAAIVDESYLESQKIYPLQMKTVAYVADLSRIASAVSLAISGILLFLIRRRTKLVRPEILAG